MALRAIAVLSFPPPLGLPLQTLVVLDDLWLLVFVPKGSHGGWNGGLAGSTVESVAVRAFVGMQRIWSFLFTLFRLDLFRTL